MGGVSVITIVSAKAQRLLRILNRLPKNFGYLSYESIQNFNSCSINTAYADTKFIIEKWEIILDLKLVDKGIITLNKSDSDFEYVRRQILKEEFELLLIWTVFSKPNLTTTEYSSLLSCSESHFRKSVSIINNRFRKYKVYIKYDEKKRNWTFGANSHLMGAQMITRIVDICEFEIPDHGAVDLNKFKDIFNVTNLRIPSIMIDTLSTYARVLRYYLFMNVEKPVETFIMLAKERTHSLIKYEPFKNAVIAEYLKITETLNQKIAIKGGEDSLYEYLYFLYLRYNFFEEWIQPETGRYESSLTRLENENPNYVKTIRNGILKLDKILSTNLNEFIDEIVMWSYINVEYRKQSNYRTIAILSDLGETHINILKGFLYEHFDGIICIDINSSSLTDISNADIIFANSKNELIENNLYDRPHVILSDIITIDEISSIYSSLFDIKEKRKVYDR